MEICWGDAGALCVKRGFHVDISRETRCNCGSIKSVIFYHDLGRGRLPPPPHCTEIDFALSFGAVIIKMIDLSKTVSNDFFLSY